MGNYNSWDYADINMKVETQTQGAELKARKWTLNIVIKFIFDKSACDNLWRDNFQHRTTGNLHSREWIRTPTSHVTEINSRNTKGSNVRAKTTNYIEKNVTITCMTSDWSLIWHLANKQLKGKIGKLYGIKKCKLSYTKRHYREWKHHPHSGRKCLRIAYPVRV